MLSLLCALAVCALSVASFLAGGAGAKQPNRVVVADHNALARQPDAAFLLVRNNAELDQAIEAREARPDLVLLGDSETGPGLQFDLGERFPAPAALAATDDLELVREAGRYFGQALACAGIDVVLAPVADLATEGSYMGWRCYGSRVESAYPVVDALVTSMADGCVVPVIKHFPGHGSTAEDSHSSAAVIRTSWAEFQQGELEMFRRLARNRSLGGMLVGHIRGGGDPSWPGDSSQLATVSEYWIGLLRRNMGFDGVLISDALVMSPVADMAGGEGYCSARFFRSGGDLVLAPNETSGLAASVEARYTWHHRDDSAWRASAARVETLRTRVRDNRKRRAELKKEQVVAEGQRIARRVAERSLVSRGDWTLPAVASGQDVPLLWTGQSSYASVPEDVARCLQLRLAGNLEDTTVTGSCIVAVLGGGGMAAGDLPISALRAMRKDGRLRGVLLGANPWLARELLQEGIPVLITWGAGNASITAAGAWLRGSAAAPGKWPFDCGLDGGGGK